MIRPWEQLQIGQHADSDTTSQGSITGDELYTVAGETLFRLNHDDRPVDSSGSVRFFSMFLLEAISVRLHCHNLICLVLRDVLMSGDLKLALSYRGCMATCFISMPLTAPFDSYYKVVARAVTQAGFGVLVAEDIDRPRAVRDLIPDGVAAADICLIDLTTRSMGTLYVLGMAHGMGKPIVYLVQSDQDLPFDLRFVPHITYRPGAARWEDMLTLQLRTALRECYESAPK